MPWWARILLILLLIVSVVLFLRLNDCHEGLSTCSEDLSKCLDALGKCCDGDDGSNGEPAFKLVLEVDSYGAFLPVNNQFECPPESDPPDLNDKYPGDPPRCREFRSGYFVQLGYFKGREALDGDDSNNLPASMHDYSYIQIVRADGTSINVPRTEVQWIDIVCEEGLVSPPLTNLEATRLLPIQTLDGQGKVQGVSEGHRKLHQDIDEMEPMALVTIWKGAEGISVETTINDNMTSLNVGEGQEHFHDQFEFRSKTACDIRIFTSFGDSLPSYPYDAGEVDQIRIIQDSTDSNHGGVHHPPWV